MFGLEGNWSNKGQSDDYLLSLRTRIGFAHSHYLFYLTAGLAQRRSNETATLFGVAAGGGDGGNRGDTDGLTRFTVGNGRYTGGIGGQGATSSTVSNSSDQTGRDTGYVLGAGIESRISQSISMGFEALYYGFDIPGQFGTSDVFAIHARLTTHFSEHSHSSRPRTQWGGFYLGLNAGGGFGSESTMRDIALADGPAGGGGVDAVSGVTADDVMYGDSIWETGGGGGGAGGAAAVAFSNSSFGFAGAHLGVNWQRDRLVFGVGADVSRIKDHFDYLGTFRGKIGIARDYSLYYLTAGLAFGKFHGGTIRVSNGEDGGDGSQTVTTVNNPDGSRETTMLHGTGGAGGTASFEPSSSGVETALVLGGGMEVKLRHDISFGIEGLYYFFDDSSSAINVINDSTGETFTINDNDDTGGFYTVKARLTYHFGNRADHEHIEIEPLK